MPENRKVVLSVYEFITKSHLTVDRWFKSICTAQGGAGAITSTELSMWFFEVNRQLGTPRFKRADAMKMMKYLDPKFSRRAQITDVRRAFNRATSPDTMSQILMENAKFVECVNKAMSHMGVKAVDLFMTFDKYNRGRLSIDDLSAGESFSLSVS